jgi:uncharacterized protein YhaN
MKPVKKQAKSIKSKIEKLLATILQSSKTSHADVLDLMSVLKYAHATMQSFFEMKGKDRPQLSDSGEALEKKYIVLEEYINATIKANRFSIIFGSWQLRTKIDALVANFFLEIRTLHIEISKRFN